MISGYSHERYKWIDTSGCCAAIVLLWRHYGNQHITTTVVLQAGRNISLANGTASTYNRSFETSINTQYIDAWNNMQGSTYYTGQTTYTVSTRWRGSSEEFRLLMMFQNINAYVLTGAKVLEATMTLTFVNWNTPANVEACLLNPGSVWSPFRPATNYKGTGKRIQATMLYLHLVKECISIMAHHPRACRGMYVAPSAERSTSPRHSLVRDTARQKTAHDGPRATASMPGNQIHPAHTRTQAGQTGWTTPVAGHWHGPHQVHGPTARTALSSRSTTWPQGPLAPSPRRQPSALQQWSPGLPTLQATQVGPLRWAVLALQLAAGWLATRGWDKKEQKQPQKQPRVYC